MTIVESGWNVWMCLVGVVSRRRVWLVGVVSRMWVESMGVVVRRYIFILISSYYLSLHLLYLFFFAAASLFFVHFWYNLSQC